MLSGLTIDGVPVEEIEVDDFDDSAADRWNDGACDACHYRAKASADPDYLKGYAEGVELRQVRVVMPRRPEGYYHMPLGTFE